VSRGESAGTARVRSAEDTRADIFGLVEEHCQVAHALERLVPGQTPVQVSGRVFDASDVNSLVDSALEFWLTTDGSTRSLRRTSRPESVFVTG
jgi:hypothetical protein